MTPLRIPAAPHAVYLSSKKLKRNHHECGAKATHAHRYLPSTL
jgi:hypothetical protein